MHRRTGHGTVGGPNHMNFSTFLALRYLQPKRTFVSVITLISIIGVTLGVAVLMVVIAVMRGFEMKIKTELLKLEPHVVLWQGKQMDGSKVGRKIVDYLPPLEAPTDPDAVLPPRPPAPDSWREVKKVMLTMPNVASCTAFVEAPATLEVKTLAGATELDLIEMRAVDEMDTPLEKTLELREGVFDLNGDAAVVSESLARRWDIHVGDKITVLSFRNAEEAYRIISENKAKPKEKRIPAEELADQLEEVTAPQELEVRGLFKSLQAPKTIFVPLHVGQECMALSRTGDVHGLEITTPDAFRAGQYQAALLDALPETWSAVTWMDKHKVFFDAIRNERGMMYVVLFFILVVAGFCIMNTLITVTIQKRKEIGVMRALGARVSQVVGIFVSQGMVVGVLGTAVGFSLGWLIIHNLDPVQRFLLSIGVEVFPPEIYGLSSIPAQLVGADVGLICGGAFILCTLAAVPPAWIVARLDPAKALRSE